MRLSIVASRRAALAAAFALAVFGTPFAASQDRGGKPPEEVLGVTLQWEASQEAQVYGYLVYRAERRAGPFRRVNERIVRVPEDGEEAHTYTFVDRKVEAGTTYYYYLDLVTSTGYKQRFSGVLSKIPSFLSPSPGAS